jgi:hypothetical protein
MTPRPIPILVITGPVGVGKSTVAAEVSALLNRAGTPHACVDMDGLRDCHPAPAHDPFNVALGLKNLAAVWVNLRAAGAERLVLADVVESRDELAGYRTAVPGAAIQVARLRASVATLTARVARRELGASHDWHVWRAAELAAQMDRDRVEDLVVETEGRSVAAVAREVIARSGWPAAPED